MQEMGSEVEGLAMKFAKQEHSYYLHFTKQTNKQTTTKESDVPESQTCIQFLTPSPTSYALREVTACRVEVIISTAKRWNETCVGQV